MTDAAAIAIAAGDASLKLYRDAPSWSGRRTACVGSLSFPTPASGRALLAETCVTLAREGFEAVIGPMDGDTWHAYRAVTRSDGSRPFPMEPRSGPLDVKALAANGFAPVSRYVSSRAAAAAPGSVPLSDPEVSVEPWDGTGAGPLLDALFATTGAAFAGNAFYRPVSRETFLETYAPLLPRLDPGMVLFARDRAGDVVGFLFGMPDPDPDGGPGRAILKTYASRRRGVGRLLADRFRHVARDRGFGEVIHALMHEDNASADRSRRSGGTVFREYALMGKVLAS